MKIIGKSVFVLGVSAIALTSAASAQNAAAGDSGLEIIVTAQRQSTVLARTPVTVAVLSTENIADAQINTEADLRIAVPGLSIRAGNSSDQLNYSIRGNTQDAFSGTRPGVLPYVNEVQIGGSAGAGSSGFFDLQSVQVLKGPQGTLFGRSATGGAVLFTTARPENEFGGYASALAGDHGARKLTGAINLPLVSDQLLARLAGFWSTRHAFQYNLYEGKRNDDMERWGIRPSLTVNFTPDIRNELVVDYYHAQGSSMAPILSGLMPMSATPGTPPYIPVELLYGGVATPEARAAGIGMLVAFTGASQEAASAYYDAYFADPKRPAGGIREQMELQKERGPFVLNNDARNIYKASNWIVTNATTFDLSSELAVKNIFGYTNSDVLNGFESDATPYGVGGSGRVGTDEGWSTRYRSVSNEIQLAGDRVGGNIDFILGYYFSKERVTTYADIYFFDILFGGDEPNDHWTIANTTHAVFGQGSYHFGESGFSLTAGLRYTNEKVTKDILPRDNSWASSLAEPDVFQISQSRTFDALSWTFGAQYQATPSLFLYAATRRAFKAGGFVGSNAPKVGYYEVQGDAFRPERVTDIEVGAKYSGWAVGMPLNLNLAAYHQWLKNSQRILSSFASDGPSTATINVPEGKNWGIELDGMIRPADWLTFGASANYIHARLTPTVLLVNGLEQAFDQVPDTPAWTGTFYADLRVPLTSTLTALAHGDIYAQSRSTVSPQSVNNAGTGIDAYSITNVRAGIEGNGGQWQLLANVKNLFDKRYYVGGLPTGQIFQVNVLIPGEPRTFTVEARFKF